MQKPSCLLLVLFALTIPLGAQAQRHDRDEIDIGNALSSFIRAFDDLDWDKFQMSFADDLEAQRVGGVAIVTFHLDDRPGFINRRTLVLAKFAGEWKILHLHASEVSIAKPKP